MRRQEVAQLPASVPYAVPLAPAKGGRGRGIPSSSGGSSSSSAKRIHLHDVAPVDAGSLTLPAHLKEEAKELASVARTDNPITEVQARPLVRSTAIWLLRQGVVNREDNPGVIQTAGELLHEIVPLHLCQAKKGQTHATDFSSRIFSYFQNHVTRTGSDFTLQVAHDAPLTTPMRALER